MNSSSSSLSKENLKMDPNDKKRRKLLKSEIASPSLSKMVLLFIFFSFSFYFFCHHRKSYTPPTLSKKNHTPPTLSKKDLEQAMTKKDLEQAMQKQNDVSMFLAGKVISALATNSNLVFSPTSINSVLTMVAATSEEEPLIRSCILSLLRSSSTDELNAVFQEIASVVLVDGSTRGGPKISAVNGVWMEKSLPPVEPSVKDLFENFFKASFALVDFRTKVEEVRLELNAWAEHHTNGLIKNILPPGSIKGDTDFVYGNALYFKGAWEHKFPKSMSIDRKFHLTGGTSVFVPFMANNKRQYIKAYDGFKVLRLPFRQRGDISCSFSMHIYLPDAKDGLDNLVKKMTSTPGFVDNHIPRFQVQVGDFGIPKFKIEFGFEASEVFKEFCSNSVELYHKALVEIDEDGAEAAATTFRGYLGSSRVPPKRIDFVADHPFLFLIKEDKTGVVMFVGQIFDPSKSSSA